MDVEHGLESQGLKSRIAQSSGKINFLELSEKISNSISIFLGCLSTNTKFVPLLV